MNLRENTEEIVSIFEDIANKANHQIPYYAYGDNEAACDMSRRLSEIYDQAMQARQDVLNEPHTSNVWRQQQEDIEMSVPIMDDGCKTGREPEVRNWLQRLEKELCRAAELHDAVCERISCVLRGEPLSGGNDVCTEEQLTPLAGQIRESVRKLESISGGYERMLSRIEL